jgi:Na+/melibiose symporter-like transporter
MSVLAQQIVDAGGENGQGGLAFVLLVILVMGIWAALFFMDRVRRRREEQEPSQ